MEVDQLASEELRSYYLVDQLRVQVAWRATRHLGQDLLQRPATLGLDFLSVGQFDAYHDSSLLK